MRINYNGAFTQGDVKCAREVLQDMVNKNYLEKENNKMQPITIDVSMIVGDCDKEKLQTLIDQCNKFADNVFIDYNGHGLLEVRDATITNTLWEKNFGKARDDALKRCVSEFVIWLDHDDVLSDDAVKGFKIIKQGKAGLDGNIKKIMVTVENTGGETFRQLRMFKSYGAKWSGMIHEQISQDGQTAYIPNIIIEHTGYSDKSEEAIKIDRNLEYLFYSLEKKGVNAYDCIMIGRTLILKNDYETAISYLHGSLIFNNTQETKDAIYLDLTTSYLKLGFYDIAEKYLAMTEHDDAVFLRACGIVDKEQRDKDLNRYINLTPLPTAWGSYRAEYVKKAKEMLLS